MTMNDPAAIVAAGATLALALCGADARGAERAMVVTSASLEVKTAPDRHAAARFKAAFEFTEADLNALRDDEATVEIRVLDRDGHGGRRLLEDLEDCRMSPDGSMVCPRGIVFQHVAGHASRWRLAIAFRGRSSAGAFHGPVTVRLAYSVSGGPETVHSGKVASCKPVGGGPTLTCHAGRERERRSATRSGSLTAARPLTQPREVSSSTVRPLIA
jgi:hypothetical protein